jgi:hypothetical protein
MKREFRPVVTPLEGRALMSAGLKGTASGSGPTVLSSPTGINEIFFGFEVGRLGNVRVTGRGLLFPGDPSGRAPRVDFVIIDPANRRSLVFGLEMIAVTAPVSSGSPSGPVTDTMEVMQVNPRGPFARDLGAIVSVSIVEKPRVHGQNLSISFTPA